MILLFGCTKSIPEQPLQEVESFPDLLDTKRDYRIDDLLDLADLFEEVNANRQNVSLAPADFKYALETKINRDYRAGSNVGSERDNHPLVFDYALDANGKIDATQFDNFYDQITGHIDYLESLGGQFGIVDIEIATGNRILANVITVVGYVNTDLSFGFMTLPETQSYQPVMPAFEDFINDRIILEAIEEDEFWTDIEPSEPWGYKVWRTDILGLLDNNCTMYAGSLEAWGGPELLYSHTGNELVWETGAVLNEYLLKGINHIESQVTDEDGRQLRELSFYVGEDETYDPNVPPIPGPCGPYYPYAQFWHKWQEGFSARKVKIDK